MDEGVAILGKATLRWYHLSRGLNEMRVQAICSRIIPGSGKSNGEFLGWHKAVRKQASVWLQPPELGSSREFVICVCVCGGVVM